MATDFTLKANFVPAELKIKELEKQLEEETKATNYAAAKMAGQREHIAQLEGKLEESQKQVAQLRDCSEFLWTIICNAGCGDWTKETIDWQKAAKLGRDTYYKALASTPSPDFIHRRELVKACGSDTEWPVWDLVEQIVLACHDEEVAWTVPHLKRHMTELESLTKQEPTQ